MRIARILASYSLTELAEASGKDTTYVSIVLSGKRVPSLRFLVALRDGINKLIDEPPVTMDELCEWVDSLHADEAIMA